MTTRRRLISFCVPVYNEEDNVYPLHQRVSDAMAALADRYDWEILFTDNHSEDATFERLADLAQDDKRVRVIRFSRNFGFQRSILANYVNARGDAAVQIDCDLQDPPELIPDFIRSWEAGYQVVYGVRRSRPNESTLLANARRVFYRLIDLLSEERLPHDAGDFRLIDRCVLNQLRLIHDQQPYLRGLIATMGFRQIGIPYDRSPRKRGKSKFNIWALMSLGLDGILHHSIVPLRLATAVGFFMCGAALLAAAYFIIAKLLFDMDWPAGWASVSVLVLFSIGLNSLLLGIIGEYIGRIFKNMKTMPLVIVEKVIDHDGTPESAAISQSPGSGETAGSLNARPTVRLAGGA